MKAVVGLIPLWDDERDSIWMLPGYLDSLKEAGALPVIFPLTRDRDEILQLVGRCDGILFTGGHDVSPEMYGETPLNDLVSSCPLRDVMEKMVLDIVIERDIPALGICRGIQFINAALGGTLYQDLPVQYPSRFDHHQKPPYDVPVHDVLICKDTPLYDCINEERIPVNSYHHQAVKDVAPGLKVMASSDDGLVEALYKPGNRFLWAVQWHPEFSYVNDINSKKIFKAFVDSMQKTEYRWTDGSDEVFGRFYLETEEYYSRIVGGLQNRTGYVPHNLSDSIGDVLIVSVNGEPVACGGLKRYSDEDVEIKRVWVEPEYRRKGIAVSIMDKLEGKALVQGYKRLILQTRPIMPDAVGLYAKLGYEQIDNYPPYDKLDGAVCYAKEVHHDIT